MSMSLSFRTLDLRAELLEALDQMAYAEMTPIQAQALPPMLQGQDVTGQAKTGSGKTAAFGLALLHSVDPRVAATQGLVLCPTRELAEQVATELRRLAQRQANTRILTTCGGRPYRGQVEALRRGAHVVVGTPGRVGKHIRKQSLELDSLRVLVLDEADRMLDMGFIDQVEEIISECPEERQTLLFSATFPDEIAALSERVQRTPQRVTVETQVASSLLKQQVHMCEPGQRNQLIVDLLAELRPSTVLVFCETRGDCKKLSDFLCGRGAVSLALHGEMEQRARDDVLLQFSNGSASVLVATNLAARGLDIPSLPLVLIAELSHDADSHLHRIGRTGRAGEEGLAISIVAGPREQERLEHIEEQLGYRISLGREPRGGGGLGFLQPPNRTLLILSGRKDKIRKGDVLGSLIKDGGIPADAIGRIDLMPKVVAVAIAKEWCQQAANHLRTGRIKNKRVRVQLLS
jgi:ATP-independent RNA helicase DbpA